MFVCRNSVRTTTSNIKQQQENLHIGNEGAAGQRESTGISIAHALGRAESAQQVRATQLVVGAADGHLAVGVRERLSVGEI